ncbi:MAG TPA: ribosome silencing factor [Gemmatimonadales bacterium]
MSTGRRTSRGTSGRRQTRAAAAALTRRELALIVRALQARKAIDLLVLDLAGVSEAADYFVIASGSSDTHVRSLAEHVLGSLRDAGVRPHHEEGVAGGRWALLDFVDCVVHVFHPTLRDYYQLERLWADAAPVALEQLAT